MPERIRDVLFDLILALAVLAGIGSLYLGMFQARLYGNDSVFFCDWFALPELSSQWKTYHNAAYFRVARALEAWLSPADPLDPLRWMSAWAGAIGVVMTFLIARALGAARPGALFAAGLVAFSPVCWFFSTTIEVHALHFATVATAAWICLIAPWGRPWLAIPLSALAYGCTYFTHLSAPLLGPGWVLLCQFARTRRHAPLRLPAWGFCAAAHLGALLLANAIVHLLIEDQLRLSFSFSASTLETWKHGFRPSILRQLWLEPLWLLAPAAVLGAIWSFRPVLRTATLIILALPTLAVFAWWGIHERGGYLLATLPFWGGLAACLRIETRKLQLSALACLAIQGMAGYETVDSFDQRFGIEDRVRLVRELGGEQALVLSLNDNAPNLAIHLPGVTELNLRVLLAKGFSTEQILAVLLPQMRQAAQRTPVLLDRSYRLRPEYGSEIAPIAEPIEAALRDTFEIQETNDPSWPFWTLYGTG